MSHKVRHANSRKSLMSPKQLKAFRARGATGGSEPTLESMEESLFPGITASRKRGALVKFLRGKK